MNWAGNGASSIGQSPNLTHSGLGRGHFRAWGEDGQRGLCGPRVSATQGNKRGGTLKLKYQKGQQPAN